MKDWNILAPYFGVPVARSKPDPTVMSYRGKNGAAAKKLKTLLEQHPEIDVQRDSTGYWVFCDAFDPDSEDDPLYDRHFATDAAEALEAVSVYVERLKAKA